MRNFKFEIEKAKKEVIKEKQDAWLSEWMKNNPNATWRPEVPQFNNISWFVGQWETGFVVCDLDELKKMPKRKREKILALGGIY